MTIARGRLCRSAPWLSDALRRSLREMTPKKASLSIHNKEGSYIFQKHGDDSIIGTFAGT